MIYAVNYDLKKPGRDYSGLYDAIKSCGAWWHYLGSTWLVDTGLDAAGIFARLKPHIDTNDYVLVVRVARDKQGWLPKDAWDWINERQLACLRSGIGSLFVPTLNIRRSDSATRRCEADMNEIFRGLRYEGIVEALDVLLADIAVHIQLSPSDYRKAARRYATLEAWMNRDGSPLKGLVELFYGQGSIATGSTIARHSDREEFDIDAMVQLGLSRWADPEQVLDLLFHAVRGEPGSRYYKMTTRRTRCVTVEYEDGMHIDLTPAVRLPERDERTSHIFHSKPEDSAEPKAHFVANPYGFAVHFNANTPADADFARFFEQRTLELEHAKARVLADAEPVPEQIPAYRKSRALISLQLVKRRRNILYERRKDAKRPPSILLAKWVADHANHTRTLAEELQHQVDCMIAVVGRAHSAAKLIHEINPACRPDDVLTDRWPCTLGEQGLFLDDLLDFAAKIRRLREPISLKERQEILVELFGESPARDAVRAFFEEERRRGDAGNSAHIPGLGRVAVVAAPAAISGSAARATPKNTFFGD